VTIIRSDNLTEGLLQLFRTTTSGKPEKNNPLVALAPSLEAALDLIESLQKPSSSESALGAAVVPASSVVPTPSNIQVDRIFLIGGAQLYELGIQSKDCAHIFMTRIQTTVNCDTFFPEIKEAEYKLLPSQASHEFLENNLQESVEGGVIEEGGFKFEYTVYNRI
jgi:dihydrofolate reductase